MRLIDADAAIDALNQLRETTYATDYGIVDCDDAISAIATLPTIQPQTGKWERHYSRPNVYADLFWHCSNCGYADGENYAPIYHHFCPNCGAYMRGENE